MQIKEKLKTPLFLYIGIISISLFTFYKSSTDDKHNYWNWFGALDTSSAVALAIIAFFGYIQYLKGEDTIKIFFKVGEKKIDTHLSLLRKEFSRSEVNGLLRMIQNENATFTIKAFQKPSILKEIQDIQKGKKDAFIIELTPKELQQFHIEV